MKWQDDPDDHSVPLPKLHGLPTTATTATATTATATTATAPTATADNDVDMAIDYLPS